MEMRLFTGEIKLSTLFSKNWFYLNFFIYTLVLKV